MNTPAVWVIYTLLFGSPSPIESGDALKFTNESGCELYMHTTFGEEVIHAFQLACFKQTS